MISQWTYYMEEVLKPITLQSRADVIIPDINENDNHERHFCMHQSYPFCLSNVFLPQCRTRFIYIILLLVRHYVSNKHLKQ